MWTLAGLHSNRWLLPSDSETFTTINYFTSQKISWTWDSIDRNELQCVVFSPYIVHSIRRDNVTHFIINQIGKNHVTRCCLVTFLRLFLFAYFPTDQSEQKPPAMCGVFSLSARLHYKTAQAELKMVWSFPGGSQCVLRPACWWRRMMRQLSDRQTNFWSNLALSLLHTLRQSNSDQQTPEHLFLSKPPATFLIRLWKGIRQGICESVLITELKEVGIFWLTVWSSLSFYDASLFWHEIEEAGEWKK